MWSFTGQFVVQQKVVTGLVGIESSIVKYLGDWYRVLHETWSNSIQVDHQFMPSIIDSAFHEWANRGVATIENLFIDNTFASIDQLMH